MFLIPLHLVGSKTGRLKILQMIEVCCKETQERALFPHQAPIAYRVVHKGQCAQRSLPARELYPRGNEALTYMYCHFS